MIMSITPLFHFGNQQDQFAFLRIIFASTQGTLTELGIGPIVTAGLILQLLQGSDILKLDLSNPRGQGHLRHGHQAAHLHRDRRGVRGLHPGRRARDPPDDPGDSDLLPALRSQHDHPPARRDDPEGVGHRERDQPLHPRRSGADPLVGHASRPTRSPPRQGAPTEIYGFIPAFINAPSLNGERSPPSSSGLTSSRAHSRS